MIELGAALALLCLPSYVVAGLLGTPLQAPAALAVARVAGGALLALAVACWRARDDTQSRAGRGLVAAMAIYNLGVALILAATGVQSLQDTIVFWPAAVILHLVMAIWCIVSLRCFSVAGTPENLFQKRSHYGL